MLTATQPHFILDRATLRQRYLLNRIRTFEIFSIFEPSAYYERPIPLRHPLVFYEGHIPAFSHNTLCVAALGQPPVDADLQRLFERGIDPASLQDAQQHERDKWPDRVRVQAFGAAVDTAILRALAHANLDDPATSPLLERAQAAYTIIEHEPMHHETFLYMLHRLPLERKRVRGRQEAHFDREPEHRWRVEIPAGRTTLGVRRGAIDFAWDNEYGETPVDVPRFEIDTHNVTNGDWLAFVRAGGPVPSFWRERDGEFKLLAMFEELPLPQTWPVYVTHEEAAAFAAGRGGRVMTEAEFHRAAFGTPGGEERALPWGDAQPDARIHGNFDFRRYDPEPIGSSPRGASAFGVHDLIGNGWEWTSTKFAPFPGFTPLPSYPRYSADFFDDAHFVVKGASPVTSRDLIRRSFRNWYRPEYPYVYANFRVVYD
jgi:formylglycine-generating enzyme required for sulfatase activity